jgi:uncharacterized protein involved in exopolysaccharide biosynthesis
MEVARRFFRLLFTLFTTIIIFAFAMLTVENPTVAEMIIVKNLKEANGEEITVDESYLPKGQYKFH